METFFNIFNNTTFCYTLKIRSSLFKNPAETSPILVLRLGAGIQAAGKKNKIGSLH
jgi:hypothetical protein